MVWSNSKYFIDVLKSQQPYAAAYIRGDTEHKKLRGTVNFYATARGVLVQTEIFGLPEEPGIFAMHIHSGVSCTGNAEDPFADAGMHFDKDKNAHPYHSGDLPPLFGNNGTAWNVVLTDRFEPDEVLNKTVIVHGNMDDFKTQPSGNAGNKIGCGEIKRL